MSAACLRNRFSTTMLLQLLSAFSSLQVYLHDEDQRCD